MYKFSSFSSYIFAPINGATSFFVHCSAFFRSLGESESDRAEAYLEEITLGGVSYCCLWKEADIDFFSYRLWDCEQTAPDGWGSDAVSDLATIIFDDGKPLDLGSVRPVGDIIFSDYIKAGIGSHGFLEDIIGIIRFLYGTTRAADADSAVAAVSSSRVSELASGNNRAALSELTLALSHQLHNLGVKAYADNFTESDIPTLRKLAKLPRHFTEPITLFWRGEDYEVYPNPADDPRYVTVDEIVESITEGGE